MDSLTVTLLILIILITVTAVSLALFVSFKIFKIKLTGLEFIKIAVLWLGFVGLVSAAGYFAGRLRSLFGILSLVGGAYVLYWAVNRYKKVDFGKITAVYLVILAFSILFSSVLAMFMVMNFVQRYEISSDSMTPTLRNGQNVLVHKYDKNYAVGDIVVYKTPKGPGSQVVGRITATPGNEVKLKYGVVEKGDQWINNSSYKLSSTEFLVGSDSPEYKFETVVEKNKIIGSVK